MDITGTIGEWLRSIYAMVDGGADFVPLLVIYVSIILVERLIVLVRGHDWNERDAINNILVSSIGTVAGVLLTGAVFVGLYLFFYQFRLFELGPSLWWAWVAAFVVHEFCYFLDHLLAHRIGFFWSFHQVHHGSNHMDLTVASRGSVLDGLMQWTYWIIAPLLGVPLIMLLVVRFFTALWGIFNHTRMVHRLGEPLENWLATPANHRVHQGRQPKYLDRNYGQVTVVFDRLFGTFQREEEEPDYGLVTRVEGYNPVTHHIVGYKWLWGRLRAAPTWADRLNYLIKPPSWSHEGDHSTAEVLRGEEPDHCVFVRRKPATSSRPLPAE